MPHEIYKLEDGTILPSVTEILSVLGSPILMRWANGLGFRHISYNQFMDDVALRGTICHEIIAHLIDPDKNHINGYNLTPNLFKEVTGYEYTIREFYDKTSFQPIFMEKVFLSPEEGFAGCPDYYGDIKLKDSPKGYEGVRLFRDTLVDWKTSKKPNNKHFLQLGGYSKLLKLHGYIPKYYMIVDFHEDTKPTIEVKNHHEILVYEEIFTQLLQFWKLYVKLEPSIRKTTG